MNQVRCLVTGGTGFIGYNLTKQLQKEGYEVFITGRPGENYEEVKNLVAGYDLFDLDWGKMGNIDVVFHEAAIVDTMVMDRAEMLRVNVEASKRLFEQAVKRGCKHIVYASSTASYGNEPAPYKEGITKQNPLNPYGESKKLLDEFAVSFAEAHPDVVVVACAIVTCMGRMTNTKEK